MKKIYTAPQTKEVKISIEQHICSGSVGFEDDTTNVMHGKEDMSDDEDELYRIFLGWD